MIQLAIQGKRLKKEKKSLQFSVKINQPIKDQINIMVISHEAGEKSDNFSSDGKIEFIKRRKKTWRMLSPTSPTGPCHGGPVYQANSVTRFVIKPPAKPNPAL